MLLSSSESEAQNIWVPLQQPVYVPQVVINHQPVLTYNYYTYTYQPVPYVVYPYYNPQIILKHNCCWPYYRPFVYQQFYWLPKTQVYRY